MRRAPSTETARRVVTVVAGDTVQRGLADICYCAPGALWRLANTAHKFATRGLVKFRLSGPPDNHFPTQLTFPSQIMPPPSEMDMDCVGDV